MFVEKLRQYWALIISILILGIFAILFSLERQYNSAIASISNRFYRGDAFPYWPIYPQPAFSSGLFIPLGLLFLLILWSIPRIRRHSLKTFASTRFALWLLLLSSCIALTLYPFSGLGDTAQTHIATVHLGNKNYKLIGDSYSFGDSHLILLECDSFGLVCHAMNIQNYGYYYSTDKAKDIQLILTAEASNPKSITLQVDGKNIYTLAP